jgi:tetratricopeptide (TPR) repeat protein
MKHSKTYKIGLLLFLIITLLFTAAPIFASKSKAQQYYNQGESYAAERRWDLAADAYAQAVNEDPKYKDVQNKLNTAKAQACSMLIGMGDDSKSKESYEEALALYKRALSYNPTSVEAKSSLDSLSQDMVARYYNLGRTYESQNQLDSAFQAYEKAYMYNPNYRDLAERYTRVKAQLQGNVPLRAILFFVNRSSQLGMETPLIQSLQADLVQASTSGKFAMIDYRKVQAVINEQAKGLSDSLNDNLAMDLGRILGAGQVVVGEIVSEGKKSNKFKITARVLKVPQGDILKEIKISHSFNGKAMDDFQKEIPELANDLAEKIAKDSWF